MKKNLKKGFTIVELVVVIAVIAVLAAVLIPTYKDLVNSAHESKDTQLVRNLNTALTSGEKHETMADALAAAASYGYNIEKINASATDKEILWDSVNDLFCYYDTENAKVSYVPKFEPTAEVKDYQYWTISDAVSEKFSTYYIGTESEVNTTKGFDAGTSSVSVVNYTNDGEAQNVVIRTNNEFGKLTINAPLDEVVHYGAVGDLDIVAVKMGSYNEHGAVNGVATLTYGKINVKNEGKISVIIANPVDASDVALDVAADGHVGALFANNTTIVTNLNVPGVKNAEVVSDGTLEAFSNKVCFVKTARGTVYYDDIQAAINAATGETTIVMLKSVSYSNVTTSQLKVNAGKNIILDLNGNVIEAKLDNAKTVNLIQVCGSTSGADVYAQLTIKDSSAGADGIGAGELRTVELYNSDPMNVSASVISVQRNGKVVIESGKIINNNANCAYGAYAIDVLTNTGAQNAWLTVNGGLVQSATYRAIRAFCNSRTGTVYITVNGGVVRSGNNNAIWIQDPTGSVVTPGLGSLTINGGTVESNGYYNGEDRFPISMTGDDKSGLTKVVTGGKLIQNGVDVTESYK